MQCFVARSLLQHSTEALWGILGGEFALKFDDGEVIQTNWRETIYSSYAWDFIREYPETPLLAKHHLRTVLGGKRLNKSTHTTLLGEVMWSVYDHYVDAQGQPRLDRAELAKRVYELNSLMYNEFSTRCEEYVPGMDILDFIEVLDHPEIAAVRATMQATNESIDHVYATQARVMQTPGNFINNALVDAVQSGTVNLNQINQCLGPRGYITEIDSNLYRKPIMRGFAGGMRLFTDSMKESRSCALALNTAKAQIRDAEYFSRRQQLLCQSLKKLHFGDCGTTKHLTWKIRDAKLDSEGKKTRASDLVNLEGKYYLAEDGKYRILRSSDKHLLGKTLKLRSVLHCNHPDPYGICSVCFGALSESVLDVNDPYYAQPADRPLVKLKFPRDTTNIGHMCITALSEIITQALLSTKHLVGSAKVDPIILDELAKQFFKTSNDGNKYLLQSKLQNVDLKLVINAEDANNITDIFDATDLSSLNITRVSEIQTIGVRITADGFQETTELEVSVSNRLASMTYPLLHHIRTNGWVVDPQGKYVVDMAGWNYDEALLAVPMRHFNMSDHAGEIASLLESSVKQMQERDKEVSPDAFVQEFFDIVNEKLTVNLAVIEVVTLAAMIVSAEHGDYRIPKASNERSGLGVIKKTMAYRSLAPAMAYEGHYKLLMTPSSYLINNRPDHPMDFLLCPREVDEYERAQLGLA